MRSRYGFTLHGHFLSEPDVGNEFGRAALGGKQDHDGMGSARDAVVRDRPGGPAGSGRSFAARRTAVRGARRWRTWPVDRASRSASGGARRWLAGGRGGLGGARRVLGAATGSIKHAETVSCDGIQAAWDGSGGGRLTRDNWCYRPSNGRFRALSH